MSHGTAEEAAAPVAFCEGAVCASLLRPSTPEGAYAFRPGAAPPLATIAPLAPPQNNVAAAAGVRARSALRADVPRTRSLSDIFSPEPAGRKSLQAKSAELFLREPEKRPRPRLGSWAQALPAARAQTAKKDPSDRGGAEQDRDAAKHDQALADFQVSVDRVTGAVKLEKDAVLDEYEQLTVADNKENTNSLVADRAALIMEITNPYHISRLNKSDMLNYWPAVRTHSQKRMSSIDILETRLEALEEHRAQLLQREVRELQVKLKDIGWVSQNALTGIIQVRETGKQRGGGHDIFVVGI
ncbi:MAG: hypothetical protein BJ554DRAFT_696 [Olpidium bornovanus]|uniref:Uncharacterized protein n=1 Tax=Olpidium bornovanus TaxID=278681 RepID=A0A8H7ZT56_9FUNG|nr:MAG: hypothetical protein BJ554DRAFT_696 [Olpidium bornovanus]